MMAINQSALANAVINITGNTQGLQAAINDTKRQMHGFMVFAQAMGGRTGGFLANMLATGGAGPTAHALLGPNLGGMAQGFLSRHGAIANPIADVDAAIKQARQQYNQAIINHRVAAGNISLGAMYNGRRLLTPAEVTRAKIEHSVNAPKYADFKDAALQNVAAGAQKMAMMFGKIGLITMAMGEVFTRSIASFREFDKSIRKLTGVFGAAAHHMVGLRQGANVSLSQYARAAAGIGGALVGSGFSGLGARGMATTLTNRASQMAVAYGDEFERIASKMEDALRGSSVAMREYGVVLSDDIVRAFAYNKGMIRMGETMTETTATYARQALILKQTAANLKGVDSGVLSLNNQWDTLKSEVADVGASVGSLIAPFAAAGLMIGRFAVKFATFQYLDPNNILRMSGLGVEGQAAPTEQDERRAMLERARDDAARADDIIRRERGRQSSNVGFFSPEDFANHLQQSIFGDPTEMLRRQTDLQHELLIVSQEQLKILQDYGYKVKDGSNLIKP